MHELSHHIRLLWSGKFLGLPLSIMTLTVLKSASQVYCRMACNLGLSDDFPQVIEF